VRMKNVSLFIGVFQVDEFQVPRVDPTDWVYLIAVIFTLAKRAST
jgi:hypothetical protein